MEEAARILRMVESLDRWLVLGATPGTTTASVAPVETALETNMDLQDLQDDCRSELQGEKSPRNRGNVCTFQSSISELKSSCKSCPSMLIRYVRNKSTETLCPNLKTITRVAVSKSN